MPTVPENCTLEYQALPFSLSLPLTGTVTSCFGSRGDPLSEEQSFHHGLDIAAPAGTAIRAVASGTVIEVGFNAAYGNYVVVSHSDGTSTLYAHMNSTPPVSVGQNVSQGDVIGHVGTTGNSTGNHLHLELRVNGARTNPLNYVPH